MEQQKKTHWKTYHDYNYLGAYMMPTDGTDIILTIKTVKQEQVSGTDGKKDNCMVVTFQEPSTKPLILNVTNAKTIQKLTGSAYVEDWIGKKIQLYVAQVNAFGDVTDAIRIRDFKPVDKSYNPAKALAKLQSAKTLGELQTFYMTLSDTDKGNAEVIALKDKLKDTFK